ncbi:hypothetical protein Aple_071060 [Acrocarpospora pleiomorpha]|uniref:cellulase n=1 Tax=Acrocarpospora pleiomorpha TaxID=90975 RepID=A0A5M3XS83_9ACTN|nr:cellulase family glycosylhydrolase [Acrocarpospora pleiomorpha]GES24207.1 hypothetical protein Aple_071060 [Acrocarpospora pleiomorpha]
MRIHRKLWRRAFAAAAAVLLGTIGLAMVQTAADAAVSCSATYAKSWDNGSAFGATVTVTNTGDPLTSWTLSFDFPNNQVITQMWDGVPTPATPTPAGAIITINPASYNAGKGTGATWSVGFNGTYTGANTNPAVSCTGTGSGGTQQTLVVSATSVSVPEGGTAGYTVRLQSQPSGNVTVTNTAGAGDNNITVTGGATLTFTSANWNIPQTVTLSAAEDADTTNGTRPITVASSGLTSVTVNATEAENDMSCAQALIITPIGVSVPEGSTASYTIRLACQPTSSVTVTNTAGSGDSDITVISGGTLTFTSANWNIPQTVTLAAAEDADSVNGSRPINIASPGLTTGTVNATESDNDGGTGGAAPALHVSGNRLVTSTGATYRLLGVNRASGEFACVQGKGMWDSGPVDQASVDAMKAWNIHAVRIPLNEECWNGTNGTPSGAAYQQNVKDYVNLLVANGITPIVEMHWNYGLYTGPGAGCSDTAATCQKPMPDAQYAPMFWTGVANAFKANTAVVFDLFNEPFPDAAANWNATAGWTCWRDGGTCTGIGYQVAGMQSLVNTVRATGATNVIMLGGLTWSNDLSQWLTYKPTDPTGNLMAAWHTYNFNACSTTSCWDSQVGAVAAQVPVHAGEIGQDSCAHNYIDQVMAWADTHGVGYTAWTWNPWGCGQGNVLITDYNGTPTSSYGEGFKAHLLTRNPLS